jgi:hypothetical protein
VRAGFEEFAMARDPRLSETLKHRRPSRTTLAVAVLAAGLATSSPAQRAYIGFVYPAGGQQGTTFRVRIGGQGLEGIHGLHVSGTGVTARVVEYQWNMSPQDSRLLSEQLDALRRGRVRTPEASNLTARIRTRMSNYVNQPACRSLSALAIAEITIAADAPPGEREIRVLTSRGPSNPMAFDVGQVPETTRPPMKTAAKQILGKESLALRKRPPEEAEVHVTLPCTMNGQIASGEINSYRFSAKKGQKLVASLRARQLVPYIADAVPGWFQPVLKLCDAKGAEVAYADDYRFRPDPVILCEIPADGEYVLAVQDSIFRGREDFVYRLTVGELPFVTSIFPLGGREGALPEIAMKGWNIEGARLVPPAAGAREGMARVVAERKGIVSNPMPFAIDTLPEIVEEESKGASSRPQKVTLPVIVNGRIDMADDWDVFEFSGKAGDAVVAEVTARRLDSPLDSIVKIVDAEGNLVGFNDDCEDLATGLNTHHADSHVLAKLPADGVYRIHIGDTARKGGAAYGYRLRISAPRPEFALRIVPSFATILGKQDAGVSVHAIRKDGFIGPITIDLKDPPEGFYSKPMTMNPTQVVTRFTFRASTKIEDQLMDLKIAGSARVGETTIVREAVPAEDRMQAFLWRHLVPAQEFFVMVHPSPKSLPKPTPPEIPESMKLTAETTASSSTNKFSKSAVSSRLRQLRRIYEDGLFTDDFYLSKVAECYRTP